MTDARRARSDSHWQSEPKEAPTGRRPEFFQEPPHSLTGTSLTCYNAKNESHSGKSPLASNRLPD